MTQQTPESKHPIQMELNLDFFDTAEDLPKVEAIIFQKMGPIERNQPEDPGQIPSEANIFKFIGKIRFGRKVAPQLKVGDKVKASPVGPGVISGFNLMGKPRVKTIAVDWLEREDGAVYDPKGRLP